MKIKTLLIGIFSILALAGCSNAGPALNDNSVDFLNLIKVEYHVQGVPYEKIN